MSTNNDKKDTVRRDFYYNSDMEEIKALSIVQQYLYENGFDGLVNDYRGCSCSLDALARCDGITYDCEFGRLRKAMKDEMENGDTIMVSGLAARVQGRLNELGKMEDGWSEGGGIAPSKEGLNWLSAMLKYYYECDMDDSDLPIYIYPTIDGNVLLEWYIGCYNALLSIDFKTHIGNWHLANILVTPEVIKTVDVPSDMSNDEDVKDQKTNTYEKFEEELTFDLNKGSEWERLTDLIEEIEIAGPDTAEEFAWKFYAEEKEGNKENDVNKILNEGGGDNEYE
jgi:hypothetical protein